MGKGKAPAANGPSNKEGVKSGIHHDFRGTEYYNTIHSNNHPTK